jgi:thioredoxin-dependent peroxiredoxin
MLKPGDKAPDFKLDSTDGPVSLKSLRGKKVVVYFYPKDDTPGCTREACDFRDNLAPLKQAGAVILGVSKDSLESHEKFRSKYQLPFTLMSDPDFDVAKAFGAYGEKVSFGVKKLGLIRSTFLIDEEGKVQKVWPKVAVDGHVEKVLKEIKGN